MEIGVVVHGPGIVDSGWAEKIIDILSNFGNVSCRLGGTMGRTAVIDAGLEDVIDISLKLLPSQSLELFNREHADVIFLLNYGKSPETGRVFGYKVFTHYFKQISNEDFLATNHKPLYESSIPVIQIERPGEEDGAIISWNVVLNEQLAKSKKSKRARLGLGDKNMLESLSFSFEELFDGLKAALDLIEVTPEEVVSDYFSNNQESEDEKSIENLLQSYDDYETSHYTYRKIHGVSPDENIFINGIVVGYSNADSIVLIARDGMIVDIINGTIKYHGLEKLGPVDLERIIVKTGLLRKSEDVNPRILSHNDIYVKDTERNLYSGEISEDEYSFKVAYVDHAAYDIYKFKDFDLVVTIGDDTSLVASDILYRFNIPIIGIIDGDLDKVVENGFVNEKSIFIEVASGFDDIVGQYINEEIFMSKDTFEMPFDEEANSVEEFKNAIFNVFKGLVIEKVKDIVPSFVEKDCDYNVIDSYHEVVDENPELVENLDEFIDGFEYESFEEGEEVYLDENYDSPLEEEYTDDDFEELSDAQLEELLVEHGSGEYEEVYFDEEIYLDDEAYPDEEDAIYYDEVPFEETADEPLVEEIYVDHDEEVIYEDVPVEEVYLDENINEVSPEEPVDEVSVDEDADEADGWAEYIEEEFGESIEQSEDENKQD
ncbi:DUF2117 domain-containing protein [uncultured Methanobrevibacter sp.]|uniref:DUF2117 domain-containing protein n=1 Tax=uncultured Methanobrevibacter sp. TaxID=253161 RepID=UPI00374237E9